MVKVTGTLITVTDLDRPRGFQKFKVPTFRDNWHMKAVRLLALHTGRLYRQDVDVHL